MGKRRRPGLTRRVTEGRRGHRSQLIKDSAARVRHRDRSPDAGPESRRTGVPPDSFELECDRLSGVVDSALFERLRWERNEGPMLAHLVSLARSALEARSEFELVEEGATRDIKRFILKIHGNRVVAISLRIEGGCALLEAHPIERTSYSLSAAPPVRAEIQAVDETWMAGALQQLFSRVQMQAAA